MRGGQGGASWEELSLCTSAATGVVSLGARGRDWEGETVDVHTGEAARSLSGPRGGSKALRACPITNFRALSVDAKGLGRGREGMVVCTSEAMGPVSLGARGRGWEGETADVPTGEPAGGLSGQRGGSGALRACPHYEF